MQAISPKSKVKTTLETHVVVVWLNPAISTHTQPFLDSEVLQSKDPPTAAILAQNPY